MSTRLWQSLVVATGIVVASLYGLLAPAYDGLPEATALGARAQDLCSLVVAGLLVWLARRGDGAGRAHLVWLGLLAYVVYSYAIYLIGVPMNRVFLVYVVITSVAGAALLSGLWRLTTGSTWHVAASPRLRRGTGWMLVVVGALFALLWLSTLLPFALGGAVPEPEGVGGLPYPVFVLDLVVVLPAIVAVGVLLLRGHPAGGPLAVIALIKIVTLFTALWAGVVAVVVDGEPLDLGPDAGPSLALLVASGWLVRLWLAALTPAHRTAADPSHIPAPAHP